jgi:hypothetical protein
MKELRRERVGWSWGGELSHISKTRRGKKGYFPRKSESNLWIVILTHREPSKGQISLRLVMWP